MAEYIEREALIRQIDEGFDKTDPTGEEQIGFLQCRKIARELPAADVAQACEWVSVSERLPEPGARVITTDGAFVGEMYINKRGKWQRYNVNDSSLLMALDVLYWMPLPEPPEE